MSIISLRLSEADSAIIKSYAEVHNMSVSELIRKMVIEKIEDELDLAAFDKAMEEYKKNPITYSHEEVAQLLHFDED